MVGMSIDLKQMREAAGISQDEMARILNCTQGMVSRYEADPLNASGAVIKAWNEACGELVNDKGVVIEDPRTDVCNRVEFIESYASADSLPVPDFFNHELPFTPKQFVAGVKLSIKKPRIGVFGKFDAGKSRLMNSILGGSNLPTSYQPSTSIVCLVRHSSDKPTWQVEDVWIYKNGFDMNRADDEEHCITHRLYAGGYESIRQYGNHSSGQRSSEAVCATVYVDAPFLLASDLVDLPGYGNNDDDHNRAEMAHKTVDAVIYMSPTTGFMGGEDINYLGALMRTLPVYDFDCDDAPLKNIFVVASHAHAVSPHDRKGILAKAAQRCGAHLEANIRERLYGYDTTQSTVIAKASPSQEIGAGGYASALHIAGIRHSFLGRYFKTLTDHIHKQGETGSEIRSSEDLPDLIAAFEKRFFFFSADHYDIREPLFNELIEFATKVYPAHSFNQLDSYVTSAKAKAKDACQSWIDELSHALNERQAAQESIKEIRNNESERQAKRIQREKRIFSSIANFASTCEAYLQNSFNQKSTVEAIEAVIKAKYDNKKDAQQLAASYVMNDIQNDVNSYVRSKATELSSEVDDYLGEFSANIDAKSVEVGGFSFDARVAFMSALSGVGTVGALGVWASIVAGGSNLGGYLLVGKIVGWLSSIGISLGSSAGVMAFVSSIGGPVTLAIAAGIGMALGVFALFGDSWETKLAKKISSEIIKQDFRSTVSNGVKKYWAETENAFRIAIEETEKEYQQKLADIETLAFSTDPGQIKKQIAYGEALRDFFIGIPWRSTKS